MKKLANDPVIIAFARTPMGKYGGILKDCRPDLLLAHVLGATLERSGIEKSEISEVIAGCANQAGEDNRNVARMAQLLAGLPVECSAITLNRLCASGLDAIISAARRIITREAHVVLAGGVESMTRAPLVMAKTNAAFKLGTPEIYDSSLGWRFFNENMRAITPPEANGITAERLATRYAISRERQDSFALKSHQKACSADAQALFQQEIFAINSIQKDEGPRADTSLEQLAKLKAAFAQDGSVSAGNSSPLSDGAAAVLISSHDYAKAHGLKPFARIIGFASAGVDPKIMGLGPVPASQKLMRDLNLSINDFDVIEINEAFAAQVLAVMDELKIAEQKINPQGGAIALGHPLGCSGARIALSLVNHLQAKDKNLGLATLCVGVGQGVSMAVEAF